MFISKLVLHKCRRFVLKGIETFEINPTMKTQIILGTNGSGKSSLLKIGFTVLPADKDDFHRGGYKLIHCFNSGKHYELRTDFSAKNPVHGFVCDGEELNTGHTGAVQKELIREHFGITQEMHDVLTGQLKFTDMNSVERREWITLLSSADFDYVIKFHGRVKRAVRDTAAVIKHLSGRLMGESVKKIDDETFNALRKQSDETHKKLITLHQHSNRAGLATDFSHYERKYATYAAEVETLLQFVEKHRCAIPLAANTTDQEALAQVEDNLRSRVRMLEAALQEVEAQYQEVDKQLHDITDLEGLDPKALFETLDSLQKRYGELQSQYSEGVDADRLPSHEYCLAAVNDLVGLLHEIGTDDAVFYDRSAISDKQNELSELQSRMMQGTSRISELEYRLNHIQNCRAINCPNCNHEFKEGVNADEESTIRDLLNKGNKFKASMDEKIGDVKGWIGKARVAESTMNALHQLRDNNPDLSELWKVIAAEGGFGRGRGLVPKCNTFIRDVKVRLECLANEREQAPIIERLDQLKKLDQSSSLRSIANSLGQRVLDLREHLMEARSQYNEVFKFRQNTIAVREMSDRVSELRADLNILMDEMVRFVAVEEIESQVKRHQVQLGMLEQSLAEAEIQIGVINDLNRSLEEAKEEEKALVQLERLLSPRDGIIAEQIMVFINTFIDAINNVISKVWGYNLALDRCDIEDGELDYKFPMYIHSAENPISDIKYGSDSQLDIVNQAFRLVVYKFLDLQGYPLYLDELGRTFDEVHRLNLTLALKELMDDEMYSQVFLISHSFEGQNSYPNSQIAVIDDSHVSLKRAYNEHVTII